MSLLILQECVTNGLHESNTQIQVMCGILENKGLPATHDYSVKISSTNAAFGRGTASLDAILLFSLERQIVIVLHKD